MGIAAYIGLSPLLGHLSALLRFNHSQPFNSCNSSLGGVTVPNGRQTI